MVKARVTGGAPRWAFAGLCNTVVTRVHPGNDLVNPYAGVCNPVNFLTPPWAVRKGVLRERGSLDLTRYLYFRNFQSLCPVLPCRRKTWRKWYHLQLQRLTFAARNIIIWLKYERAWIWVRIVKIRKKGLFVSWNFDLFQFFMGKSWSWTIIIIIPTNHFRNN